MISSKIDAIDLKDPDVIKDFSLMIIDSMRSSGLAAGNLAAKVGMSEKQLERYIKCDVNIITEQALRDILSALGKTYEDFKNFRNKEQSSVVQIITGDGTTNIGNAGTVTVNH